VSAYLVAVLIGSASNGGTRSMPRSASLKSAGAVPFRSRASPKSCLQDSPRRQSVGCLKWATGGRRPQRGVTGGLQECIAVHLRHG
jgi:hypothetical protein